MTPRSAWLALSLTLALLAPGFAQAADTVRGGKLAYTCHGCHGIPDYRNAYPVYAVPKLGGQTATYLEIALRGYRDGTRAHPTMVAQSASLTDQQISDVAAFLASHRSEAVDAGGETVPVFQKAAACAACHGQNGIGVSPQWPTLAGQHEEYIVHALNQYRDGSRQDALMSPMAAPLTDQDIKLLAEYFSGLDGLETTSKAD